MSKKKEYQRNDDDVRRLAEVIFTRRVAALAGNKVPSSVLESHAVISLEAADAFGTLAEGFLGEAEDE